jgi:hypothetical protein
MKRLDSYNPRSTSSETGALSARDAVLLVTAGSLAVTGALVAKNHVETVANENMGNATYKQITGEDRSKNMSEQLDNGLVIIDTPVYDPEDSHRN